LRYAVVQVLNPASPVQESLYWRVVVPRGAPSSGLDIPRRTTTRRGAAWAYFKVR